MKLYKLILITAIFTLFVFCKKRPVLGPATSKVEGITSNWILDRVDQIDVNNKLAFVESDTLLNVTKVFIGSKTAMHLNIKSDGRYSIATGSGENLFKLGLGNWQFDDVTYPTTVIFNKGNVYEFSMPLLKPIRPQDQYLVLKANKFCGNTRTVSYQLWFKRD